MQQRSAQLYPSVTVQPLRGETDLHCAATRRFLTLWREGLREGPWNAARILEILDLCLADRLYVVDCARSDRYEMREQGQAVRDILGINNIGKAFRFNDANPTNGRLMAYYKSVTGLGLPMICSGTLEHFNKPQVRFESVDLPVYTAHGKVTHIVGVMDVLEPNDPLGALSADAPAKH